MSKHNKTGRSKYPDGQFITLPYYMLKSEAWRSLKGNSVRIYLELHMRFNGKNNGMLYLGMDKIAELLGVSKSTVHNAFKELQQKGFIVKIKPGQWIRGQAAEWRLTSKPYKNSTPTNDWKNWKSTIITTKKRKPYGSTKQAYHDFWVDQKKSSVQ
jgi:biotin operon repressor